MMTVVEDWRKLIKEFGRYGVKDSISFRPSDVLGCFGQRSPHSRILNKYENSRRWEEEADAIKADVMRNGWKEEIQSFYKVLKQYVRCIKNDFK